MTHRVVFALTAGTKVWYRYDSESTAKLEARFSALAEAMVSYAYDERHRNSESAHGGSSNSKETPNKNDVHRSAAIRLNNRWGNSCCSELDKRILERFLRKNRSTSRSVLLELPSFGKYSVDVVSMRQTNVAKSDHQRHVRRLVVEDPAHR